jgi:hypothetical protein
MPTSAAAIYPEIGALPAGDRWPALAIGRLARESSRVKAER